MAFIAGQDIFTNDGWKKIEDLAGNDKVLVRNFIGDAELIQPFALRKKKYNGEIIQIGAKDWSFSVTPEHEVVYDADRKAKGRHFKTTPAIDFVPNERNRIYRKFKYMFSGDQKKEQIRIYDEFGRRTVTVQHEDWYKLVGYVLCRGFIKTSQGRPMLFIFLDEYDIEREISILGDILDRIGLYWHVQYSEKTRAKLVVSSRNTLASRIKTRLGSFKRKEMYLPDKMIYQSTKELANILIETIIDVSTGYDATPRSFFQMNTTNKKLIDSLVMFGTLYGYGVRYTPLNNVGDTFKHGVVKNRSYGLRISQPTDTYAAKYKRKKDYSGYVYGIDLFEGQVYIREGSMPIWIDPK